MSKGFGKWQRAILAELATAESFWLRSLLGRRPCTKAKYNALLRAAMKLENSGLILIDRYFWGGTAGKGKTAIRRIGAAQPARHDVVSVGKVPTGYLASFYQEGEEKATA